jgi:hypothetical protein
VFERLLGNRAKVDDGAADAGTAVLQRETSARALALREECSSCAELLAKARGTSGASAGILIVLPGAMRLATNRASPLRPKVGHVPVSGSLKAEESCWGLAASRAPRGLPERARRAGSGPLEHWAGVAYS